MKSIKKNSIIKDKKNVRKELYIIIISLCLILERLNFHLIIKTSTLDDMKYIELYLQFCKNDNISEKNFSEIKKFPKISIISPIYNRGEYLSRFLKSIQYQNFNDIEIILIDDYSSDNTVDLIKKYQFIDKRIILLKNKQNFGTFKSRNLGILKSTGEYSILPDPDDILSQDCLKVFYVFATKYNYEMLRFNLYVGRNNIFFPDCANPTPSRAVFQPELQTFLFYATKILRQIDFNVSNKFVKREALIRALNMLSKEYLNMYMTNFEDGILNYMLYRVVKSFYFLKKIGYYYIRSPHSITIKGFTSNTIKFIFIHLNIVFEYSKNTLFEKNMFNILFKRLVIRKNIIRRIRLMKGDLKFYFTAIENFLDNEFVSINNKKYLILFKQYLNKAI